MVSARAVLFLAVGAAMLAGLFLRLRPDPIAEPAPAGGVNAFAFVVRDGRLASGPALLRVRQGEAVRLSVTSNRADELHLHGYDLQTVLSPDQAAVLEFTAHRSGHFEFELHEANVELGALDVLPQ